MASEKEQALLSLREDARRGFLEIWGPDFTTLEISGFWMAASGDGEHLAMTFSLKGGSGFGITIPAALVPEFMSHVIIGMDRMALARDARKVPSNGNG